MKILGPPADIIWKLSHDDWTLNLLTCSAEIFNLRGCVVQWRVLEGDETFRFDKLKRLWDGQEGL